MTRSELAAVRPATFRNPLKEPHEVVFALMAELTLRYAAFNTSEDDLERHVGWAVQDLAESLLGRPGEVFVAADTPDPAPDPAPVPDRA